MILKEATDRAADIEQLTDLMRVSPASCRAAIQKQIDRIRKGASGEREAAHFLQREFGRSQDIAIFHDLRLGVDKDYAQIDHLVIDRIQQAAWVLETKNYSGRLTCDEHGDWTVWRSGKPQPIPSPINQARRQCELLRRWLRADGVPTITRIHPVVLISPTSSIDRRQLPPDAHIVKSDNFGAWWRKQADAIGFATALVALGRHLLAGMSQDEFLALGNRLVAAHVAPTVDWHAKLRLPRAAETPGRSGSDRSSDRMKAAVGPPAATPSLVSTPHGDVMIARIPDGRYALRNEKNDALIALVRSACRGKGQWNPRFRNWLIPETQLPEVLATLSTIAAAHELSKSASSVK